MTTVLCRPDARSARTMSRMKSCPVSRTAVSATVMTLPLTCAARSNRATILGWPRGSLGLDKMACGVKPARADLRPIYPLSPSSVLNERGRNP